LLYDIEGWELNMGDTCALGSQLRPFIVWFGEAVPKMDEAIRIVQSADIFVVIGTSLVVYPAAGLVQYTAPSIPVYMIDPGTPEIRSAANIQCIRQNATEGVQTLKQLLGIT
jgi:NAD-dependent deacetylase